MTVEYDREELSFAIENEFDMLIPFSLYREGEDIRINAYGEIEKEVEEYISRSKDGLFSFSALSFLFEGIKERFYSLGFETDKKPLRTVEVLELCDANRLPSVNGAEKIEDKDIKNLTTYDIETTLDDGRVIFGIKDKGILVSLAATAEAPEVGEPCEVGVETVPLYRKRGYALSSLVALTRYLLSFGVSSVEYRHHSDNSGSAALAKKAGFITTASTFDLVFYRKL